MRTPLLPLALLCSVCLSAQTVGNFALAIDPPGENINAHYIDGAVSADGSIAMLCGYQNIDASAFTLTKYDVSGALLWSHKVGTTNADFGMDARKVVFDANGNMVVFGIMGTAGGQNYFMVRISGPGEVLWARMYHATSATNDDYGFSSMKATSDGGLLMDMGMGNKTIVVRTDMEGTIGWSRSYVTATSPTNKNPGFDFAATNDGGMLLTEKAEDDIYLVRIAANGDVVWATRYPNGYYNHAKTAISLDDGGFLVAGISNSVPFAMRTDASGSVIWEKGYAFNNFQGNVYVEYFARAAELSTGELLLTCSENSTGVMALLVSPLGEPVQAVTLNTSGYTELIGQGPDHLVIGGRLVVPNSGGNEDRLLLLRTNEALDVDCLSGSSMATATDIEPTSPPTYGCTVQDEEVNSWSFDYLVSDAVFTAQDVCSLVQGINEPQRTDALNVFPSPATSGTTLTVDLEQTTAVVELQCVSADGRLMKRLPVRKGTLRSGINTDGWANGLYLLRALDANGHVQGTARVVLE